MTFLLSLLIRLPSYYTMRNSYISALLLLFSILVSCGESTVSIEDLVAKGGRKYGGEFRFMSSEKVSTFIPTFTADQYSSRIVSQIFEPLLTYEGPDLEVVPAVAESYSVSDDGTEYTFKIRKGVLFHDDPCFKDKERFLTAADVKFTLELACSGLQTNQVSYLLKNRIEGANEFFEKSKQSMPKSGVSGIKLVDDYTIRIKLNSEISSFERIIAHVGLGIISKVAYEAYSKDVNNHPIGSGPFALESKNDEKIVLNRHPEYWKKDEFGNQLPFLERVILTYSQNKRSELMAFRKSEVDMVLEIPVDEINNILGSLKDAQEGKNIKHKVDTKKSLNVNYVATAVESDEFSDVQVRQAFNHAINRTEIVDKYLQGEGWAATKGFVPEMADYENDKITGPEYNPEMARTLMARAGYPNGKGFPTLDFYVNGKEGSSEHVSAKAVAKQLKDVLNVNLTIKLCTIEERRAAVENGTAKIWRAGWIADYPDPDNFLNLFYGGNANDQLAMVNSFNFRNAEFDNLYEASQVENNPAKRNALLQRCDQIIVDQAPVFPILTDDHIVMLNARVRNFEANSMESINLGEVFIKELKKN